LGSPESFDDLPDFGERPGVDEEMLLADGESFDEIVGLEVDCTVG
jgi:hypothetical protein